MNGTQPPPPSIAAVVAASRSATVVEVVISGEVRSANGSVGGTFSPVAQVGQAALTGPSPPTRRALV